MKKLFLPLFLFLSVFVFFACSDDNDDSGIKLNFESRLTSSESEFISESTLADGSYYSDSFQDEDSLVIFKHYYSGAIPNYYFAGFTYMNKTDNKTSSSPASITGSAKSGKVYLAAFTSSYTPAEFTIKNPAIYSIQGLWVTNSTYAYNSMTVGDSYAKKFSKGSWYKLTATGYDKNNAEVGTCEVYLANYSSDNDKPVNKWIWFDLSQLSEAVRFQFDLSSTDNGKYGMNTAAYFCMDDVTLTLKPLLSGI